jgi:hypothetical protein
MPDFSLLETPNYLGLYKQSEATARLRAKEDRVQNALAGAGKDLAAAESELIGLGAFEEASQLRTIRTHQARKKAADAALALDYGGAAAAAAEGGDVGLAERYGAQGRARALGGKVAAGDLAGASAEAMAAGDFDLAASIGKLSDREMEKIQSRNSVLGAIAFQLQNVPYAARKGALQTAVAGLKGRGFSDEELARLGSADPTDENLAAFVGQALTLKEAIDLRKAERPIVLGNGAMLADQSGEVIARNAKTFAPVRAPRGGGAAASSGLPPGYEPVN